MLQLISLCLRKQRRLSPFAGVMARLMATALFKISVFKSQKTKSHLIVQRIQMKTEIVYLCIQLQTSRTSLRSQLTNLLYAQSIPLEGIARMTVLM